MTGQHVVYRTSRYEGTGTVLEEMDTHVIVECPEHGAVRVHKKLVQPVPTLKEIWKRAATFRAAALERKRGES